MSDIHGKIETFKETLGLVDLCDNNNKLVLLGDYVGRKGDQTEILLLIKSLMECHKEQVIVLMGNHEFNLLESKEMEDEWKSWESQGLYETIGPSFDSPDRVSLISKEKNGILSWLSTLPYYYETKQQIYVHAGIEESAGKHWKLAAEDYYFCQKYPPTIGTFKKDIIAGHVSAKKIFDWCRLNRVPDIHYDSGIFWDGLNHFFIDGKTEVTNNIPVLKYNTNTGVYSSFRKTAPVDKHSVWEEYVIKP